MTFQHYTHHDKLKSKLSSIVDCPFKGRDKTFIRLSDNGEVCWVKKAREQLNFSKALLKTAIIV